MCLRSCKLVGFEFISMNQTLERRRKNNVASSRERMARDLKIMTLGRAKGKKIYLGRERERAQNRDVTRHMLCVALRKIQKSKRGYS